MALDAQQALTPRNTHKRSHALRNLMYVPQTYA
jgi:hypothetical protein